MLYSQGMILDIKRLFGSNTNKNDLVNEIIGLM